jgi:hypothetical protein
MKARIVTDEPISNEPGPKLMKRVTVELCASGWTKMVTFTMPAVEETMQELDQAVRKFLRENGKGENFDWA